jgi:single-strand DNA-binding protein
MSDLNRLQLLGRLTRDPQLRFLQSGMPLCEFGMAVGEKFKGTDGQLRENTMFIDCKVWGKRGEVFNEYMSKGTQVYVEGRLVLEQWNDKNGGGKRSKHTLTVEDFKFIGNKSNEEPKQTKSAPRESAPTVAADEPDFTDEEIPF